MGIRDKTKRAFQIIQDKGTLGLIHHVRKSYRLGKYRRRGQKLNSKFGWRSNRHIVVIESDDWGAERVAGPDAVKELEGTNYFPRNSHIIHDGLETADDVTKLCDVLNNYRDIHGNPAVLTANFVLSNPDFSAIKKDMYTKFHAKPIDQGWNHEPNSEALWKSYKEGISSGVIVPQLHGIRHCCSDAWLKNLRSGDKLLLKAFDLKMIGEIESGLRIGGLSLGPIYHADNDRIRQLVSDGVRAFVRIFGAESRTTIAPCYGWRSPETELALLDNNIYVMQGREYQHLPNGKMKSHYTGEYDSTGMLYLCRNCILEPLSDRTNIEDCIAQISQAFQKGLPAIICTHRYNYTSRVSSKVRDRGLLILDDVLRQATKIFPDIEFLSSDKLGLEIINDDKKIKM